VPAERAALNLFLTNYDCVVLANVPGGQPPDPYRHAPVSYLSSDQQETIRAHVHDQGLGLVMTGGPNSFGAGEWQGTPIERALPVDCAREPARRGAGVVLILDAYVYGTPEANDWERNLAAMAIRRLQPDDQFGILRGREPEWFVPLEEIGTDRVELLNKVGKMSSKSMRNYDAALDQACGALCDIRRSLTSKHIIIVSLGINQPVSARVLQHLRENDVMVSVVTVDSPSPQVTEWLQAIPSATRGKLSHSKSPKYMFQHFSEELRLYRNPYYVSAPFEPRHAPGGAGPVRDLPEQLLPMRGFVATWPKKSPAYREQLYTQSRLPRFCPLLANWQYGLGRSVAFTSDADRKAWGDAPYYESFWSQVVAWAARPADDDELHLTTEPRERNVKIVLEFDERQDVAVRVEGGVTPPRPRSEPIELHFTRAAPGRYIADFPADDIGTWLINVQVAKGENRRVLRTAVTVPYSREFAVLKPNTELFEKLRLVVGGKTFPDAAALRQAVGDGEFYRSVLGK
jgi:hypothetical protein